MIILDLVRHEGISLPFNLEQADGVFVLLLLCFFLFSCIYKETFVFFKENIAHIFMLQKGQEGYVGETTVKDVWYSNFLIFQTTVLISISIYSYFMENGMPVQNMTPLPTILSFIVLVLLFVAIKVLFYRLIGYVFNIEKGMKRWIDIYFTTFELLGIIYFIPTLFLIYSTHWHPFIIGFMAIVFIFTQILLFYRITIFFLKEKFNYLFLIVYLCSVEVIPYLFLIAGFIYLYEIDIFNIFIWP